MWNTNKKLKLRICSRVQIPSWDIPKSRTPTTTFAPPESGWASWTTQFHDLATSSHRVCQMELGFCVLQPRVLTRHLPNVYCVIDPLIWKLPLSYFNLVVQVEASRFVHYSISGTTVIGRGLGFNQVEPITVGQPSGQVAWSADGPITAVPWDFGTRGPRLVWYKLWSCYVPIFFGLENVDPRKTCWLKGQRRYGESILGLMAPKPRVMPALPYWQCGPTEFTLGLS